MSTAPASMSRNVVETTPTNSVPVTGPMMATARKASYRSMAAFPWNRKRTQGGVSLGPTRSFSP